MRLPIEMIGNKIRTIRKEKGFTLEEMASKTGLSKGLLSQVERGISQPSLESLWRITKALESPIVQFFEDVDQSHIHLIPKERRRFMLFPDSSGTYSLHTPGGNGKLGVMQVHLQPGHQTKDQFIGQDGEECVVVLRGTVLVKVGNDEYHLTEGDSIYFGCSQPHMVSNPTDEEAHLLWALVSPQF